MVNGLIMISLGADMSSSIRSGMLNGAGGVARGGASTWAWSAFQNAALDAVSVPNSNVSVPLIDSNE